MKVYLDGEISDALANIMGGSYTSEDLDVARYCMEEELDRRRKECFIPVDSIVERGNSYDVVRFEKIGGFVKSMNNQVRYFHRVPIIHVAPSDRKEVDR